MTAVSTGAEHSLHWTESDTAPGRLWCIMLLLRRQRKIRSPQQRQEDTLDLYFEQTGRRIKELKKLQCDIITGPFTALRSDRTCCFTASLKGFSSRMLQSSRSAAEFISPQLVQNTPGSRSASVLHTGDWYSEAEGHMTTEVREGGRYKGTSSWERPANKKDKDVNIQPDERSFQVVTTQQNG